MVDLPCLHVTGYIPCASGANVHIRFVLHNAVLDRKLVPTHRSMVNLPCLHVTGHIPFASGANVNIRFFRHNAVLHRKLVPTHRSMVDLPCLHVTGHIPFASRANIHIPFRNDLRIPHLETVTTCTPVIYLARAYTAPHRLLASGTNILETLAFPRRLRRTALALLLAAHFCLPVCASFRSAVFSTLLCLRLGFLHLGGVLCFPFSFHAGPDISRRPHRPLPFVAVFPLAMSIFRPVCAHFCSVLLFGMLCLRLCVLHFGALLFSVAFSFRDGVPDTGDGTYFFSSAAVLATFACVAATRCTALLMLARGMGHFQQLLQTWSPLHERCCASHGSKAHAACFTLQTLHLHRPHALPEQSKHTLPPVRARLHAPAEYFFSSLRVLQTLHTCVCSHVAQMR